MSTGELSKDAQSIVELSTDDLPINELSIGDLSFDGLSLAASRFRVSPENLVSGWKKVKSDQF